MMAKSAGMGEATYGLSFSKGFFISPVEVQLPAPPAANAASASHLQRTAFRDLPSILCPFPANQTPGFGPLFNNDKRTRNSQNGPVVTEWPLNRGAGAWHFPGKSCARL